MGLKNIAHAAAAIIGAAVLIGAIAVAPAIGTGVSIGGVADPVTTSTAPTGTDGNGWGHS